MIEIFPTVWISERANISHNIIFGDNIHIYGAVEIAKNTIIENNVTIGHPSPFELSDIEFDKSLRLMDVYDAISEGKTYIGSNSIIRSNTTIYNGTKVENNFDCAHNVTIRENCQIGKSCYVFPSTYFYNKVSVGNNCRINGTLCARTIVGNYTSMLGHTSHEYKSGIGGEIEPAPTIHDGVIVGRNAIIIGNISVGKFSYIAANSVLLESTKEYSLMAGTPAKLMRYREHSEVEKIIDKMEAKLNENN
jgi:acetyltransferase-like isoleucine patch superfamily enzyme